MSGWHLFFKGASKFKGSDTVTDDDSGRLLRQAEPQKKGHMRSMYLASKFSIGL